MDHLSELLRPGSVVVVLVQARAMDYLLVVKNLPQFHLFDRLFFWRPNQFFSVASPMVVAIRKIEINFSEQSNRPIHSPKLKNGN